MKDDAYYPRIGARLRAWRPSRKLRRPDGTVVRYICRIEITALQLNPEIYSMQPQGFDREPNVAWLNRFRAQALADIDRAYGGNPTIQRFPCQTCKRCGSVWIGASALVNIPCNCRDEDEKELQRNAKRSAALRQE